MLKRFFIAAAFVAISFSCTDDSTDGDTCIDYQLEGVQEVVDVPTLVEGTFAFEVSFQVDNGCGQFYAFDEQTQGNSRTIRVSAKYEGCICTQDMPILSRTYQFAPTLAGTYTLNFVKPDGTFITRTVVKN
ncbi:hypothetical protein [Flavobacterium sp.]|uniref:hypothetical protein n=1 Tax=Flavobacterium sp. TaxID=239 RepID=UPI0026128C6B|nr:hypothetical protein [Flavobacterium sp.]